MPNNALVSETFPPVAQVMASYNYLNYGHFDELLTAMNQ